METPDRDPKSLDLNRRTSGRFPPPPQRRNRNHRDELEEKEKERRKRKGAPVTALEDAAAPENELGFSTTSERLKRKYLQTYTFYTHNHSLPSFPHISYYTSTFSPTKAHDMVFPSSTIQETSISKLQQQMIFQDLRACVELRL